MKHSPSVIFLWLIAFGLVVSAALFILAPKTIHASNNKTIYGLHETIYFPAFKLHVAAKLDTGATTSSLSARNIETFTRNDDEWVRFQLAVTDAPDTVFEKPLARISRIKRRADEDEEDPNAARRPVILLDAQLGNKTRRIEVNLVDRSHFKFPFLVGATALKKFNALIDPAKSYTQDQVNEASKANKTAKANR